MTCEPFLMHSLIYISEFNFIYIMASNCTILLQILAELADSDTISSVPGVDIIESVAGTESDSTVGLTYYFTQTELQELLESERCTQLSVLASNSQ